jgi:mRNA-degrading endonuclease RelE of RelBE toxin-antitoxin system
MPPYRIEWLDEAKADVRALDQAIAMRMFEGILRFALRRRECTMAGSFRLRLGDCRVLFNFEDDAMRIFSVRHRSEAYR